MKNTHNPNTHTQFLFALWCLPFQDYFCANGWVPSIHKNSTYPHPYLKNNSCVFIPCFFHMVAIFPKQSYICFALLTAKYLILWMFHHTLNLPPIIRYLSRWRNWGSEGQSYPSKALWQSLVECWEVVGTSRSLLNWMEGLSFHTQFFLFRTEVAKLLTPPILAICKMGVKTTPRYPIQWMNNCNGPVERTWHVVIVCHRQSCNLFVLVYA